MTASGPTVVPVPLGERSYPVVVGRGILGSFLPEVALPESASRALVVSQQPVVDAEGALNRRQGRGYDGDVERAEPIQRD